jgi:hypothetical protein
MNKGKGSKQVDKYIVEVVRVTDDVERLDAWVYDTQSSANKQAAFIKRHTDQLYPNGAVRVLVYDVDARNVRPYEGVDLDEQARKLNA